MAEMTPESIREAVAAQVDWLTETFDEEVREGDGRIHRAALFAADVLDGPRGSWCVVHNNPESPIFEDDDEDRDPSCWVVRFVESRIAAGIQKSWASEQCRFRERLLVDPKEEA